MSPKQPFLDLVFLPKVKINGEDWIEKRGYGIYTGVIHGDFSYNVIILEEDEELLTE